MIFNGDNYSEEWHKEAEKRGLPNNRTTVSALPALISKSSIDLFTKYKVLTKREIESRHDIYFEQFVKAGYFEPLDQMPESVKELFRYDPAKAKQLLAEAGYPGFWSGTWYSIVTRAGTSRAIVDRLNREIIRALQAPDAKERLEAEGYKVKTYEEGAAALADISASPPDLVVSAAHALDATLKKLGIARPRIAVAGINPHAGEDGLFGDDDERITKPAVAQIGRAHV